MHIETLKIFCDVVETGSFSKAAAKNLVTQSAVSQQLRMLEEKYDAQLLERGRQSARVTPAGEVFYKGAKQVLESYRLMERQLRETSGIISGTVRVATIYSVGLHKLPPYVKTFIKQYPQAKIHLAYRRTNEVYAGCLAGTTDLGIVAFPRRQPQLEVIPFAEEKLVLICSSEHPLAKNSRIAIERLNGEDFIGFERDIPTRKAIDRIFKEHRVHVNYVMEFDNIETIKRSVEAGTGISIVPESTVQQELRAGTLVARPFTKTFWRSIGIIYRKQHPLSLAAQKFIELLLSHK